MGIPVYEKFAAEDVSFGLNLTGKLPSGITLSASGHTVAAYDKNGSDVSGAVLHATSMTVDVPNSIVKFRCKVEVSTTQPEGQYAIVMSVAVSAGGPLIYPAILLIKDPV